jgi:conjugative relaxase-like TrwC/TraI family protein
MQGGRLLGVSDDLGITEVAEGPTLIHGTSDTLADLGLVNASPVSVETISALALGAAPDGRRLVHGGERRAYFDLTFSTCGSLSAEFAALRAAGNVVAADALLDDWRASVDDALRAYAANMNTARRWYGDDAVQKDELGGLVWLTDLHSASRPVDGITTGDPNIHIHARLFALSRRRSDGNWSALQNSELFQHSPSIAAVADAAMRKRVEGRGYRTREVRHGGDRRSAWTAWELDRVPESLIAAFSSRTSLINELVAEEELRMGHKLSPKQKAALSRNSRSAKIERSRAAVAEDWAAICARHHYAPLPAGVPPIAPRDNTRIIRQLIKETPDRLLDNGSVWTHAELFAAVADQAVELGLTPSDISFAVAQTEKGAIRMAGPAGAVFSTRERIEQEERVARYLIRRAAEDSVAVSRATADRAIAAHEQIKGYLLSDEQRAAVYAVTDTSGIAIITGVAGAGKSSIVAPSITALRLSGYQPYGLATASTAAATLSEAGGFPAWSVADFLTRLEHDRLVDADGLPIKLDHRAVLVLDEAGMSNVAQFAQLTAAAQQFGVAKLVLLGSSSQLQPIGSGSLLAWLEHREGIAQTTLGTSYRQLSAPNELEGSALLLQGKGAEYLQSKDKAGLLTVTSSLEEATTETVRQWSGRLRSPRAAATVGMVCDLRGEGVDKLNQQARAVYIERGWIDPQAQTVAPNGRLYSPGDRVELQAIHKEQRDKLDANGRRLFRRDGTTPRKLTEKSPTRSRGWVVAVHPTGDVMVELDEAGGLATRTITVSHEQQATELDYGYASTTHGFQGSARKEIFWCLTASRLAGRQSAYVAQSRSTSATHVIAVGDPGDRAGTIDRLGTAISRDLRRTITLDYRDDEARERLRAELSEQQTSRRSAWSADRRMTEPQRAYLSSIGVEADAAWSWLRASVEIDMRGGTGIPGAMAESALCSHGVSSDAAHQRVSIELRLAGLDIEAAMHAATSVQQIAADRRVAEWAKGASARGEVITDDRVADLRARTLAQEVTANSRPDTEERRSRARVRGMSDDHHRRAG